ncbi:ribbon-helix-helix domain-containing protein [Anatilimnocola floriformis]|uniref:ribbon-helix-helix domain-containing protein n=1 Tax=Anatilimnocola floriformis TaxID=2948575 RepID=UPI0020C33EF3|nr:type II toxin-antitoxin system ParD family antitoxin [Anatilimnocola floriformis]
MTNVTLQLSDDLQQFVASETQAGQFAGPAAYIQALIERAKLGKAKLADLLIEGLDSGEPIPLNTAEWQRIRAEVEQRRG